MLSDVTSPFFKPTSVRMPPNSQSQQTQLKKDISKLPEESQKEHYLFKTAPSEGNRANVGTGRGTAREPALRSSPTRSPPLYVGGGPPPPAALPPHFHYLPAHPTPRCDTQPGLSSSSCSSPPPGVPPVLITSQSFQGRPTASSHRLLPLTVLEQ